MLAPDTTVAARVRAVLGEVLGPAANDLENPSRDTVPEWDSLAQVEVLFALEEEFEVRFPADKLLSLTSLETIIETLRYE
jgi:acyl carrier protein